MFLSERGIHRTTENQLSELSRTEQASVNNDKQDRTILFVSNRDGNDEIYSMTSDGLNIVRLTNNNVPDGRASWSANGQHIAFASGVAGARDIYVMNANGSGLRNLTNTPTADEDWPEWAPTGNKIIFSSNREGNHEIYTVNFGGDQLTRLTFRPQDDKWPTYSPDGSTIAFQTDLGLPDRTDVFVMISDGSGIKRLTTSTGLDQMPAWSPDGNRIAFMSTRDGNPEVYLMNSDGSNQDKFDEYTRRGWTAILVTGRKWNCFYQCKGFCSSIYISKVRNLSDE